MLALNPFGTLVLCLHLLSLCATARQVARHSETPDVTLRQRTGLEAVSDVNDTSYEIYITLNGQPFFVQIDTGSTDLFVVGSVVNATDLGANTSIPLDGGTFSGPIKAATLELAGLTVQNQAFLEVPVSDDFPEGHGLIGLAPFFESTILGALEALNSSLPTDGFPALNRLFGQNASLSPFFTVLLGRTDDPDESPIGELTIGEAIPGYEKILEQPKVDVVQVDPANQHWQVLLDEDGILGPDGQAIETLTGVSHPKNKKQLTAVFDTGFSLPQVPPTVAEAIYSRIPGARFSYNNDTWVVPCTAEVNLTFKIAGQSYPVHPLDTTLDVHRFEDALGLTDVNPGECVGLFQPDTDNSTGIDVILGMAFLRNVYLLFNEGHWAFPNSTNGSTPFVQLLSTTNSTAHQDFVNVRLNGTDTTDQQHLLPPANASSTSTSTYHTHSEAETYMISTSFAWTWTPAGTPSATPTVTSVHAHADLAEDLAAGPSTHRAIPTYTHEFGLSTHRAIPTYTHEFVPSFHTLALPSTHRAIFPTNTHASIPPFHTPAPQNPPPQNNQETAKEVLAKVKSSSKKTIIIFVVIVVVLLVAAVCVWLYLRHRNKTRSEEDGAPSGGRSEDYQKLDAPAPAGDMEQVQGYGGDERETAQEQSYGGPEKLREAEDSEYEYDAQDYAREAEVDARAGNYAREAEDYAREAEYSAREVQNYAR
ncbi:acid protease [Auriscalpium vulgare]|uniref:Acid protease n=1 Tax=Auriscalpium vulgare TaxID=40419 RepID=A0ACB8S8M1_9AGAM|nr:acid protease [Auriscalpium vulgare]